VPEKEEDHYIQKMKSNPLLVWWSPSSTQKTEKKSRLIGSSTGIESERYELSDISKEEKS
jgi:hypothetical protein